MPNKSTDTLSLSNEERQAIRELARAWGLTIGRGPMASEGSIQQLVSTIASGDAAYFLVANDTEYSQVARLRELANGNSDVAGLLERVATALERAGKLFHD